MLISAHRFLRSFICTVVTAAAAACTGPTEPAEPIEVTINVLDAPPATVTVGLDGLPAIRCGARIEVVASGSGRAVWTRRGTRRYSALDGVTPLDSVTWPYAGAPLFSRDTISRSRPDTAELAWLSHVPMAIEEFVWYRQVGQATEQAIVQRLECGPALPPGASPPTAEVLEVRGSDGALEFGDTLIVRYRATSGGALFRTRMVVGGGFGVDRNIAEDFALVREREERFVVPRSAVLNAPIPLWFTTFDVGGRYATAAETSAVMVVDVNAPVLSGVDLAGGQFMVGARLNGVATATDERLLSHIVWEFGDPINQRDSIATGDVSTQFEIVVPPEWAGRQATLRVYARDHGGNYSVPWVSAPAAFAFYPNFLIAGEQSLPLEFANEMVYDRQRDRLYSFFGSTATAIDLTTMDPLATIPLPALAGAADITLSGDSLLVTQSGLLTLSVIDLDAFQLVDTVPLPVVDSLAGGDTVNPPRPTGVRVLANGKAIIQLHREAAGGSNSVELDLTTGQTRLRSETDGGGGGVERWWSRMGVSPDRSWLVLFDEGCTRTYRAATDAFSACMSPDPGDIEGFQIGFDSASTRVLAGGRLLTEDLVQVGTIPPGVSQLSQGGQFAFVADGEGLLKIRIADGLIMGRLYLGFGGSTSRLVLLKDGNTMVMLRNGALTRFDLSMLP